MSRRVPVEWDCERGQVRGRLDSKLRELGRRGSTNAPDLFYRHCGKQLPTHRLRTQVADAAYCGRFFAMKLATSASVFVGAIPTHVGMPTHCLTRARSSHASGSTSLLLNSPSFRKLSSMD